MPAHGIRHGIGGGAPPGGGLLLGGGGLLLWSKARRARLRALPRSRAKQARPGTSVKVVGRLRARMPVRTPLTGVDCLYYRLRVWEEDGDDIRQLFTETEYAEGWELEDESGLIGLEGAQASFSFLDEHEYSPGGLLDTSGLEPEPVPVVKDEPLRRLAPARAGTRPE